MKSIKDFKTELDKDYYIMFTKMYRDFSSTCNALSHSEKKKYSDMNSVEKLRNDFYRDQIDVYRNHLGYLFNEIETDLGREKAFEIEKYNTREYHFNELLNLLEISKEDLIDLLFSNKVDEYDLKMWFELLDANSFKQDRIYKLHSFLVKLSEIDKDNHNLLDILNQSFIDNSEYCFDEDDNPRMDIVTLVLSTWRDKTDYEIAYEAIKNYKEVSNEIKN